MGPNEKVDFTLPEPTVVNGSVNVNDTNRLSWLFTDSGTAPPKPGCTLTQGYWKTHSKYGPAPYDARWALVGEDTAFFSSGKTWYEAINTSSAGGNAYYILARQYIAAKLNLVGRVLDARRQLGAGLGGRVLRHLDAGVHAVEGRAGTGDRLRRHDCRLQRG
jgi:hypothetical protein